MKLQRFFLAGATLMVIASSAGAAERHTLAAPLCSALTAVVDATGPAGPVFVASYQPGPDEKELPPALAHSAFTYDNALAVVALVACGDVPRARRLGDALLHAVGHDRHFKDGRLRNAYRAGPVVTGPPALPGWWDAKQKLWAEDAYQDGTATGNVAWGALALLTLDAAAPNTGYRAGARRMLDWITAKTSDQRIPAGFSGGIDGFDGQQTALMWKSTEHNLDVHAVAAWLYRLEGNAKDADAAAMARNFLDAVFAADPGMFRLGTTPDGALQLTDRAALDTQLWPLLGVADAPEAWRRAVGFAERELAVPGGFDFNDDRDGLWIEGTAQAALTLRALGRKSDAFHMLDGLKAQIASSGLLFAAGIPRLTTGLAVGPNSVGNDFFYFRRPHLGATAWAVLAATGWNPFTGRMVE